MQINDSVLYNELGKDFVATVLEIRELDNHSGANGEPLLHLGFFAPVFKPGADGKLARVSMAGTHQQTDLVQFRFDVAHVSHSFDPKLGLATYPGGRWREAVISEPEPVIAADTPKSSNITDDSTDISGEEGTVQ